MNLNSLGRCARIAAITLVFVPGLARAQQSSQSQPKISKFEREEVLQMLDTISSDVKKHYYDPKPHGIDWDANVKNYRERITTTASLNRGLSEVAAALDVLNDSHTFFLPPPRPYTHDFGWQIAILGEKCFVLKVRPGSDAEQKGVKPGDAILTINGFAPARDNLWKMNFVFNALRPQPELRVSLLSPKGEQRDVNVIAAMRQRQKLRDLTGRGFWDYIREIQNQQLLDRMRYVDVPDDIMILKLPGFEFTEAEVDQVMKKARQHKALIMDLRGNPGGAVSTLNEFLGNLFDHDVKICDRVTRDNSKPQIANSRGKNAFTGKLFVLLDSRSASASEILARVVQLQKRGMVIGDKSAGAVMESRHFPYKIGFETIVTYGASITEADLIMTDGKSLEHAGVIPDELLVPTGADLAAGRDPVLAHAVELAGGNITPEAAGKLLAFEWPKD
jgi:carboxyl-terminal processing protease